MVRNWSVTCNDSKFLCIKCYNSNSRIYNIFNNSNFSTKPFVKKLVDVKKTNTNAFSIIGKKALVIKEINPIHSTGQIKINGEVWSAESENSEIIQEGLEVEILQIKGVKAIVKPIIINEKISS